MDTLSDEMLITIFELLPPRTIRETVKLVCRRWNMISKYSTFTSKEKIIFYNNYNISSVIPHIDINQRIKLRLAFHHQEILWNNAEMDFWKSCGERVRSIHLECCTLSLFDLKMIIEFCPNLKMLHLLNSQPRLLKDFDSFVELNFVAPSITVLQFSHLFFDVFDANQGQFRPQDKMLKILAMFPNVVSLWIRWTPNLMFSTFDLINILCSLDIMKKLINLTIQTKSNCFYSQATFTPVLSHLVKIKQLHLLTSFLNFDDPRPTIPLHSLFKLSKITSLNLRLNKFRSHPPDILSLVLSNFTHLRHLQLRKMRSMKIDQIVIQKLLHSKLEFLSLGFRDIIFYTNGAVYNTFNETLESMAIGCSGTHNSSLISFISLLATCFRKIQRLAIHHWSRTDLHSIFLRQTRLKMLQLYDCSCHTSSADKDAFRFISMSLYMNAEGQLEPKVPNMSSLAYLTVPRAFHIDTIKSMDGVCFPELRRVRISRFRFSFLRTKQHAQLMFLKEKFPLLNKLILGVERRLTQEQLEEMLRSLKHLRYVKIQDSDKIGKFQQISIETCTIYNYEKFFEVCPSLRHFVHNNVWFYYNVLKKELEAWEYPNADDVPEFKQ